MKAISPMIATILLIAFTVAVGGIISIWMTGYTRTTGAAVSGATENVTACINTFPDIHMVTNKAIIITNPGSENIANIVCFAGNGSLLSQGENKFSFGSLTPGNSTVGYWCNSTGHPTDYEPGFGTSVVCTASCRGIGVRGECKVGQLCWSIS